MSKDLTAYEFGLEMQELRMNGPEELQWGEHDYRPKFSISDYGEVVVWVYNNKSEKVFKWEQHLLCAAQARALRDWLIKYFPSEEDDD